MPMIDGQGQHVHYGRPKHTVLLVIVKTPNVFYRNRLGRQDQGRLLFWKEEVIQIPEQSTSTAALPVSSSAEAS